MPDIKLNQTAEPLTFLLVSSSDHISPVTGLGAAPTVTLMKAGAAFVSPAGAISEVGNGWYKVSPHATDANTLGELVLHATGTGADPTDRVFQVVAYDPRDSAGLGLTRVDAPITSLPSAAQIANAVWNQLEASVNLANSMGLKVKTLLDAAISSRSSHTAQQAADATIAADVDGDSLENRILEIRASANSASGASTVLSAITDALGGGVWRFKAAAFPWGITSNKVDAQLKGADADTLNASALAADAVQEIRNDLERGGGFLTLIKATTDKLSAMLEQSGGIWRWVASALSQAPVGEGGGGGSDPLTPPTDLECSFDLVNRRIDAESTEFVHISAIARIGQWRYMDVTQYAAEVAISTSSAPEWHPAEWDATGLLKILVGEGSDIGVLPKGILKVRVRLVDAAEQSVIQCRSQLTVV